MLILFSVYETNMVTLDLKEMGLRFAKARVEKNLAARRLSLMMGKNAGYIYDVEIGKVNISLLAFVELCNILEVDPKEFFGESVKN